MNDSGSPGVPGFLSPEDCRLAEKFMEEGYVIAPAANGEMLERIRWLVAESAASTLGVSVSDPESFFNQFHEKILKYDLNSLRVDTIRKMNSQSWLRRSYFEVARPSLEILVGNELAMQLRINLSIQLPGDRGSLLPIHADVWAGDSPFEVVVWLPLVDCYGSKAMYILPPAGDKKLREEFDKYAQGSSEELFDKIKDDVVWIEISHGQVLIFNQNLPHGNRVNEESETRWSMNCRFKGVFTPYGDKKLGEFFEPITLRPASRLGIDYRFPSLESDPSK